MKTRMLVAVGAACALTLSACGTTAENDNSHSENTNSETSEMTYSAPQGCDNPGKISTGPVSFTDDLGRKVELDKPAQRVAILEWQQIEDLLTLCQKPVGVSDIAGFSLWNTAEKLPEGVTDLGTRGTPNMSALVETNPDLVIIETEDPQDETLKALEAKGLTVAAFKGADATDPLANMLNLFHKIATATGREERAAVVEKELKASLEEGKKAVSAAGNEGTKFVYFDGWVQGGNVSIRPFGQGALTSEVGEELGLTNVWTQDVDPTYGLGQTDLEGLSSEAGDAYLLYTGTTDPDGDFTSSMKKSPVWQDMPAVKDGRTSAFPSGIWTFGGPRSVQQMIQAYTGIFGK